MSRPSRRGVLTGAAAVGGSLVLPGCSSLGGPSGTRLQELFVDNRRANAVTVTVRLTVQNERVYENQVDVQAEEVTQLQCDWPWPVRSYELAARLDGSDWTTVTVDTGDDACIVVDVEDDGPSFRSFLNCPTGMGRSGSC